jgi:hypothetical protein
MTPGTRALDLATGTRVRPPAGLRYDCPMEVSDVRRLLRGAIEEARRRAGERRVRVDEATRNYDQFLETTAVPAFHVLANALVGEGHRFKVTTPGRTVRLSSERAADDFVQLSLDTERPVPVLVLLGAHGRGRRSESTERVLREGPAITELTEEELVTALLEEIIQLIER